MHNLHLVRVFADTAKEAYDILDCDLGDSRLYDNIWIHIVGSVSDCNISDIRDKDSIYSTLNTLEALNQRLQEALTPPSLLQQAFTRCVNGTPEDYDWDNASCFCTYMHQLQSLYTNHDLKHKQPHQPCVLSDIFFEYELTQFGITELNPEDSKKKKNTYIVLLEVSW